MKGIISAQIVQDRNYAAPNKGKDKGKQQSFLIYGYTHLTPFFINQTFSMSFHLEYEKLWAAVTGGRGAGRGKKKVIVKGVDRELLKYGKS